MKVGLNLLYLVPGRVGGTEVYARELVGAMAQARPEVEFSVFCGREAAGSLRSAGWPENVVLRPVRLPSAIKPLRIVIELLWLPMLARRARVDLLHSLGTTAPLWGRFARVVTIHDLIYHHFPRTFPALARLGLELLVPRGARHAHRVLADSQATKDDLVATCRIDPEKIDVVYLGLGMPEPAAVTSEPQLRDRFALGERPIVLSVAAALAHKNIDGLLHAFRTVVDDASDRERPVLVVTGHAGRDQKRLTGLASELDIGGDVRFTGWVDPADLEGLYRCATCFVYPSKFEGFGLPVLEAMQRGTPVASSDATSLSEVVGGAALVFDPTDTAAIAGAIEQLLGDPALREEVVRSGRKRAAEFSWQKAARKTLAVYERAMQARA